MSRHIAFLADIHGNLTALEAVLADLARRGITEIYFLGDMLGKGPSVREIIDLLRKTCTGIVYGNWDRMVVKAIGGGYERFGAPFYVQRLTEEDKRFLSTLPETLEIDFCGRSLLAYHGRFSIDKVVTPMFNNERENVEAALYRFGPHDITIMGDAHHPFMLTHHGRFLLNTGAVGNPCDKMPLASYLILHDDDGVFSTQHVRVPYDISKEISRALHTPDLHQLPVYIAETATARYMRNYNAQTTRNAWKSVPLKTYEAHMAHENVAQAQMLNALMQQQLSDYPYASCAILGIAGGNGLEHAEALPFSTVWGIDINEDYLAVCRERFAHMGDRLQLLCRDLSRDSLPTADLVLADLLIEYIGVERFVQCVQQTAPRVVSCVIQYSAGEQFVTASPYTAAFEAVGKLHKDIAPDTLIAAMHKIGYLISHLSSHALPGGKLLLRLDFKSTL